MVERPVDNMTDSLELMKYEAIDMHGHIGQLQGSDELAGDGTGSDGATTVRLARSCGIKLVCVSNMSAFSPSGKPVDIERANHQAQQAAEKYAELRFYTVLNPKDNSWRESANQFLQHPRCIGVKLHTRMNHWCLSEFGDEVFDFLNERKALVLAHTGNPGSEPELFVPYANKYRNVKLILGHLGHDMVDGTLDRQIKAVKMADGSNIWIDTSSRNSIKVGLIDFAVQQVGAERILFGTDSPLYVSAMQKAGVCFSQISSDQKRKILYENAAELLGL
jgi:uncharacterized protein